MKIRLLVLFLITILMISCKKDKPVVEEPAKFGKIAFQFLHKVNGQPLLVDTLVYINAAGNEYDINEIQYFISDVTLHNSNGNSYVIAMTNGIHYIDTDIPSTYNWAVSDDIPVGDYSSISFTFGINQAKNINGLFVNPPEVNMWWPEFLGGGYHYMKMNGNWKDTSALLQPFNFHLGIGQIYAHDTIVLDSITGFVQNYFTVTLPNSSFTISDNTSTQAGIIMNIESWFTTPHDYDFNYWGGSVMQNQAAMHTITENGADVFTFQLNP
jgi:hypothetical protein